MKVQLTLEMDIEIDKEEYPDLDEEQILKSITVYDDDVIDGFGLTTHMNGYDNTQDFFLSNAKIVSKQALPILTDGAEENEERMEMTL